MTCKKLGCCGGFLNFLVGYWNFGLIALGGALIVATVVLGFTNTDANILINDPDITIDLLNWSRSALNIAKYVSIGLGGALMIMGLIGLIGACFTNRCLLILFEIFAITVFIAHTAGFAFLIFNGKELTESAKNSVSLAVGDINNQFFNFEAKCKGLFKFSKLLQCCGNQNAFEIVNEQDRETCCDLSSSYNLRGCNNVLDSYFKSTGIFTVVLPNALLLVSELFYIVATPFLIKKIAQRKVADVKE